MPSIYVVRNDVTGKLYVGQTSREPPARRWQDHLNRCRKGERKRLYDSIRRHGEGAFTFVVIETWGTRTETNEAEEFWIDFFRSWDPAFGYNMTRGGEDGQFTAPVIEHLRAINTGDSNPFHGRHHSEEARRRIGDAARNRDESTLQKLSAAGRRNHDLRSRVMRKNSQRLWADPAHRERMSQKARERAGTLGKLTEVDVACIKARLGTGEKACDIAIDYGVAPSMVTRIKQGTYNPRRVG